MRKIFYQESGKGLELTTLNRIVNKVITNKDGYPKDFTENDKKSFNKKYVVPYMMTLDKVIGTHN